MSKQVTKLAACSALLLVSAYAGSALAGEEPYIATVCDDKGVTTPYACNFGQYATVDGSESGLEEAYLSGKEYQFTHRNTDVAYYDPLTNKSRESFVSQRAANVPDPCITNTGLDPAEEPIIPNLSAYLAANLSGTYSWTIVLPKRPESGLNLQLQCALLKPNSLGGGFDINTCAGEEGERIGPGTCSQALLFPGQPTITPLSLPRITATVSPGVYSPTFATYNLTALRTPNYVNPSFGAAGQLTDGLVTQALTGNITSSIPLKACFTENIYVKQPVEGQVNGIGQTETDLRAGDIVTVTATFPRGHNMDVYCHAQSLRIAGIGDPQGVLN